ncbi:MAG TPA: ParA family protein [Candidatus Poseidoniales archaeon]|nr:ParA family protein [Candidatus Poseidoniales archaeon]HIO94513.1 ParA family protein [Candidatus Poseidoniales archaeon]
MHMQESEREPVIEAEFEEFEAVEIIPERMENLATPGPADEISIARPRPTIELPEPPKTREGMARIIACINQKGGVGKTTTVINVGAHLATMGLKVLVVDCDSQGNCATGLGIDKSKVANTTRTLMLQPETAAQCRYATPIDGLHLVVGDRTLVTLEQELVSELGRERRLCEGLAQLQPHYDIILIDTPPSLGIVTINALTAADAVMIPVQTEYFALEGLAMLATTLREVRSRLNPRLGVDAVFLTMHAPTLLNGQVAGQVRETLGEMVVEPPIRRNIRVAEAPSHGIPIHLHAPHSHGGEDYRHLAENLALRWGLATRGNGGTD